VLLAGLFWYPLRLALFRNKTASVSACTVTLTQHVPRCPAGARGRRFTSYGFSRSTTALPLFATLIIILADLSAPVLPVQNFFFFFLWHTKKQLYFPALPVQTSNPTFAASDLAPPASPQRRPRTERWHCYTTSLTGLQIIISSSIRIVAPIAPIAC
jgi:hypothetical protein